MMKRFFCALLAISVLLTCCLALVSCGKEGSGEYKLSSLSILGFEKNNVSADDVVLELNNDESANIKIKNEDIAERLNLEEDKANVGTWTLEDNKLTVKVNDVSLNFKKDGNKLTYSILGVIEFTLSK